MSTQTITTAASDRAAIVKRAWRILLYLALVLGAIVISLPWWWMVLSGLKSYHELYQVPLRILPERLLWGNYADVFYPPMSRAVGEQRATFSYWPFWIRNTLIIAAFTVLGTLGSNSLVAFSLSRLRWKGRNLFFFFVLAMMFLPGQVTMIPRYIIFTRGFGWANTWYPQIVPAFLGASGSIFLLRQFMMTIPLELDESARLDGCNDLQLFLRLILPMSKPALGAISIFTFQAVWNDYFTPLLYIRKDELANVAIGLERMKIIRPLYGDLAYPREELTMAAATFISLPLVLLFFTFQKYYIQGVVITGVKG